MPTRVIFTLFDHDGEPLEGVSPVVAVYRRADGEAVPPPTITERGDGFYEFLATTEVHGPVAYLVDAGPESSVQYFSGSVGELIAFAMYDESGNPDGARNPGFLSYTDGNSEPPSPEILNLTGGLYGFWPEVPPGEIIYYNVGDAENTYSGTVGSTVLANPSPAPGTPISRTQAITLDVLDSEAELGRVLICIEYSNYGGATELVWDGEVTRGPYVVTSVPIPSGYRYTVRRIGRWPGPPTVRVFVTNFGGREI